ncbi:metal-dependent phosphohydrolase [Intrasporangium oryzae NRRL B-24470]|uniref:Metal-dependent phosphohydrolase n=1 Tax=Intrasporangium oryzae NRRL B-24470 TaxID=1386089 RepID=W9G9I5_9MICO|nr:HD domain-containing phosphohydrolase [Intrasporangium oryzae]EWT00489.1 metal-dependent phosphohydrolase [Intrasporangium oryzae NRRL B-24470]
MNAHPERFGSAALVLGATALVVSVAVAMVRSDGPPWSDMADLACVVAFATAIALGEWLQLAASGFRGSAPISTAAAFGLVFTVEIPEGHHITYGASFVIAVTAVSMAAGALARQVRSGDVSLVGTTGRLLSVAVAAVLYRVVHLRQHSGVPAADDGLVPWQSALLMLGIAGVALLADILFTSALRTTSTGSVSAAARLQQTFVQEVRSSAAISTAVAVTGVLIALAAPAVGVSALPLFLAPLVLTLFAFRRYVSIRATYLQSIRTLSRLTDAAGYTLPGHSERVAALSVAVGRALGVPERELLDLEYAALLHDIGQVALVEPIPGGATVLAAPADQRRIGADTLAIVRETGVLDSVAGILEHQTTPYRQVRELGEEIPLTSRIIKVVNAFEDLTGGQHTPRARDGAIERIYLGLGYEYDPRVVDALLRVLGARTPAP